ncbi:MAG: YigZ family protein [Bacteroidetes bacterium]|nr:YigZ family protein [Bacteroidota bacterium]
MLFEDTYKTIKLRSEGIYKEKGSKFIAIALPVCSENDVKEALALLRKEFYDARHHCYAYILGFDKSAYRINDDGEPSGTAGRPIHGQLMSKDLTNTLVVVVRYFGGTKLGVSGLINAYKTATKEALESAEIIEKIVCDIYEISFDYLQMNDVMKLLKDENLHQFEQAFETACSLKFTVRKNNSDRLYEAFRKIEGLKIKFLRTE